MTVFIYILSDPRTQEIRYVGKTISLRTRVRDHIRDRTNSHKTAWLKQLREAGLRPEVEAVETFENSDDTDWQDAERWWIQYLRAIGCPLTNLDSGGIGGKKHAAETNAKIARASTGRQKSPEERRKLSESKKGWKRPPHHLEATIRAWTGRKHQPETLAKMRETAKAKLAENHEEITQRLREWTLARGRGGVATLARLVCRKPSVVRQWVCGARRISKESAPRFLAVLDCPESHQFTFF